MGFDCELLIAYRRDIRESSPVVWEARERIVFGRVTRLEKLTNTGRFGHLDYGSCMRAGICAVSILLGKLFAALDASPREAIAPPFLPSESEEDDTAFNHFEERETMLGGAQGDLVELDGPFENSRIDGRKRRRHNQFLAMDEPARLEHLKQYHPVMDPPFLWERCATLASWLQEAEDADADEWRELAKNPVSIALARAQRAYLREIGRVETRAIFNFPR